MKFSSFHDDEIDQEVEQISHFAKKMVAKLE